MGITSQKVLVGLLGLALFGSLATIGYVERRKKEGHKPSEKAALNPKLARGREIYEKLACAACHGADGKSGAPNFNSQTGQQVPPVAFVADSFTKEELKQKIIKGVSKVEKLNPDGPVPPLYMPGYEAIISDSDLELLIDYLKSLMPKEQKESW